MASLASPRTAARLPTNETRAVEGPPSGVDDAMVGRQLWTALNAPDYCPPQLPTVALELVQLAGRLEVKVEDVVKLLERDALLSGRIFKVANSAMYAGQMPMASLRQAVMRLGLKNVRDLVLEAAMNLRIFRAAGYTEAMERLRHHTGVTAHLARLVCRYTSFESEYAFLCGLLHDVGAAASLLVLGDTPGKSRLPLADVLPAVDRIHEQAGALVLRSWGLPPELELIVRNHHQPKISGYPHPVVAALAIAEALASEGGLGFDDLKAGSSVVESSPAMAFQEAMDVLRISDKQLVLLRREAGNTIAELKTL